MPVYLVHLSYVIPEYQVWRVEAENADEAFANVDTTHSQLLYSASDDVGTTTLIKVIPVPEPRPPAACEIEYGDFLEDDDTTPELPF